jgi:hypothetical protein
MTSNCCPRVARPLPGPSQLAAGVPRRSCDRLDTRRKGPDVKSPGSSFPGKASPNSPEINVATLGEATAGRVIVDVREEEPA